MTLHVQKESTCYTFFHGNNTRSSVYGGTSVSKIRQTFLSATWLSKLIRIILIQHGNERHNVCINSSPFFSTIEDHFIEVGRT